MKFIVTYGCDGLGNEKLAVEAENEEVAMEYAYNAAFDYREGYAGLHGTQDFSDFCEEEGYDTEDEDAWDSFHDMIMKSSILLKYLMKQMKNTSGF